MSITPDSIVYLQLGPFAVSATIVFTWLVMALLLGISLLATRKLRVKPPISRWQHLLEIVVSYMRKQIGEITNQDPDRYLPFIGTLFLFIAVSNALTIIPWYEPPTGSLYTTGALALCVFIAVPLFGIARRGVGGYFRHYIQPSPFMLPFNIIGEASRTLALAVRLFGNVMSGSMIVAILLSIAPLFLPIVMQALGLLIGLIQAYIFAVLATVYIASATRAREAQKGRAREGKRQERKQNSQNTN
jgi:F-type H+-transporting ATPase subunit a